MTSIVIDSNVWVKFCENTNTDEYYEVITIILKIYLGEIKVGISDEVLEEYRKVFSKYERLANTKKLQSLISREKYAKNNRKTLVEIPAITEGRLTPLKNMGFHDDDIKFVRIAPNTVTRIIVSEDGRSFLEEEYQTWLNHNLQVTTMTTQDFVNR